VADQDVLALEVAVEDDVVAVPALEKPARDVASAFERRPQRRRLGGRARGGLGAGGRDLILDDVGERWQLPA